MFNSGSIYFITFLSILRSSVTFHCTTQRHYAWVFLRTLESFLLCIENRITSLTHCYTDPFHEVKRKRDRKKENLNKESTEPKWRPGMQGRGNRGGRGNYSSRHSSNDAGGGRTSLSAKENGINHGAEDRTNPSMPQGQKNKETFAVSSSSRAVADGSSDIISENTSVVSAVHSSVGSDKKPSEVTQLPPIEASKSTTVALGSGSAHGPLISSSNYASASKTPSPSPGVYLSDSDPILMPSQDSRFPVGTIRREVGSQRTPVEQIHETPLEIKSIASGSEGGNSSMQGKAPNELQEVGKNLLLESPRPGTSSHVSFSIARPSSNYNNRLQQAIGQQKVGPGMEWKPKPTNPILAQGTVSSESIKVPAVSVKGHTPTPSASSNLDSKDATSELERKLEESHISDDQHVIIPNHLHVPEAEKLGFCFGSFDASFGLNASSTSNGPVTDKSSEASEEVDESIEQQSRTQNALATADERDRPDRPTSFGNVPENLPAEGDVSSNAAPEYRESKQETSLPTSGHQYPVVHTSPNFSFGFMPPMIGSQLTSFENNESQSRDGSHVPSFVVQQPFDPASYYAQFYRPGADNDGRLSPFHSTGVPTKYNGNVAVLSPQASQSSQEVGNSLMLSAAGPTPIATQTAGVMQNSIAVTQQPLPVFRQPTGVHLPHYPPNYIPYGPYFSPFYVPPPAIHQFLSNGAFPQQHQAGSMYPAPPVATPKYPLPQYKPGSNAGNSTHIGMAGNYGPYGSPPASYNPGSATTAGNSTSNEDLGGSQFKENNVYITGQQSEGSGVWIAAPGRDMASSFYNLPQGGQVAYTPTQAGHGAFASIYHPAQPVTTGAVHPLLQQSQTLAAAGGGGGVDMAGGGGVYQQPQPAQINWPNNY
ncbi:uncharacterized protein LOC112507860 isoform X1 [Cynara cardunculus var. scolymus]|uniref:uncharacterized protein LOC112507860 isoform X1 n=2 Tax=Cynara cardunculus var. scolymus TaxID=59895 RepID=UPI000D6238FD|nr:uncharacterized protein LOC112507860 isoform X1 [Cynara cardunculus var. scolymus]XP_024968361.1 uncharacterized protein LOC112507860 isoform X1 [Cynara cardunculus var. scolymus]